MLCKHVWLPLLALVSSGCSQLIAYSGQDLTKLTTKQAVRDSLGIPTSTGENDGQVFDEFHLHRKISDVPESWICGCTLGYTFGLGEIVMFPRELYLLGRQTIGGRDVRFDYDAVGNLTAITLVGEKNPEYWRKNRYSSATVPESDIDRQR
jgi:YD repeat-containing protein